MYTCLNSLLKVDVKYYKITVKYKHDIARFVFLAFSLFFVYLQGFFGWGGFVYFVVAGFI